MDSGNSGSMQSSSGGDEEYESRAESISPFLNLSGHVFGSISNPQPQSLSHHHHQSHPPTLFDPQSHNLDHAFSHSPANPNANPLYNLDFGWSRNQRSEPNYADFGNLTGLSSSSGQSVLGAQGLSQGPFPSSSSMPLRSVDGNAARSSPQSDQTNAVKNSKKRTRASRRAPTTVLTTDTTNFRQMVQEFTGIPAAPFSASPYSRRLDLFGTGSAMRSGHLDTLGPLYPLRPSAQKVQLSPYASSSSFLNSSMSDPIGPTTSIATNTNNTINTSIVGTSNNYNQQPSDPGLQKQSQNMLNMQNPILNFQSLLQSSCPPQLKPPLPNAPNFGTKSQGSSRIPSLDELGMSQEHVTQLRDGNSLATWRHGGPSNGGGQEHLGSFDGNNGNSQNVSGYKLHSSASASDFHTEKGLENISSRGEGTVDSWICPSD